MNRIDAPRLLLAFVALSAALSTHARSDDRRQSMVLEADTSTCTLGSNMQCEANGRVKITQGTLVVDAAHGTLFQTNGTPSRAKLTGGVTTNQQLDDGTPVRTSSGAVDYDFNAGVITLEGNVVITQPKGEVRGARVVYNTRNGQVQAGGGGQRVRMVIQPKGA